MSLNLFQRALFKLTILQRNAELAWTISQLKHYGNNTNIDPRAFLWGASKIEIYDNVSILGYSVIYGGGGVVISKNAMIGANCIITSISHPIDPSKRETLNFEVVKLMENCWLGAGSIVLPGVTIGKNSIVAAGSVCNKRYTFKLYVRRNTSKS